MIYGWKIERAVMEDPDLPCLYNVRGPCSHPRCLEAHFKTLYAKALAEEQKEPTNDQ